MTIINANLPDQAMEMDDALLTRVKAIRSFNRAYVTRVGVLDERLFDSDLSLTEVRIMFELSLTSPTTATALSKNLALDCGYLSRILNRFEKEGWVAKERSLKDARQRTISVTKKGAKLAADISSKADQAVLKLLKPLATDQQVAIIDAMASIMSILDLNSTPEASE